MLFSVHVQHIHHDICNIDIWGFHASWPRTHLKDLGADVLVCSAYKFFGPHLGLMAFNKDSLRNLQPSKVP